MLAFASLLICSTTLAAPSASRPAGGAPVVEWTQAGQSGAGAHLGGQLPARAPHPATARARLPRRLAPLPPAPPAAGPGGAAGGSGPYRV